jgi:hypothetical protein
MEYTGSHVSTLMGDFRTKFFQYGEEHRKQRKLRKALARETYMQAVSQKEEEEGNCVAQNEDRDSSSSER